MTADRLREAADRLDEMAVELERMHIKVAANPAALLRTVADSARQQGTDAVWWPLIESGIWTDAFALAEIILGDTDD